MSDRVTVDIRVEEEGKGLELPAYQSDHAAGRDLRAAIEGEIVLGPGARALLSTGICVALPEGYEAQIRPRSGIALRHGLTLLNSPGTVDADYRGVVRLVLINHGKEPVVVRRGERLAQMVVASVAKAGLRVVDDLPPTLRGDGGFGHTGR